MLDIEAVVAQGKADLYTRDREKAIKAFDKAIKADLRCIDAYLYRGFAHLLDSRFTKAIDDFTSVINAFGTEDEERTEDAERKALAYWGRSCTYHQGRGNIGEPEVAGVVAWNSISNDEHVDRSRRDEQEAVRLFWTAQGSTFPDAEHEFEVPGEIVRTRDLIHEFLATSDWGEWINDRFQKNTNNHRFFRRGNFIFGSPARMVRFSAISTW